MSGNDPEIAAPFDRFRAVVRPEWIDHNGHMNMGFYLVVFDFATDAWFRYLGLGEPHRAAQAVTTFCLEAHVTYHREVRAGDPLRFTTQLLAWDAKRLHYFHEMYHAADGFLAATNELVSLHVSEATRRAAPMAPEILDRLARIQAVHDARRARLRWVAGWASTPPQRRARATKGTICFVAPSPAGSTYRNSPRRLPSGAASQLDPSPRSSRVLRQILGAAQGAVDLGVAALQRTVCTMPSMRRRASGAARAGARSDGVSNVSSPGGARGSGGG